MANRREVLVGGGLAAVGLGLASRPARTVMQPVAMPAPALFLVDTMLSGADAAIAAAERRSIPVVRFSGDVGTAWFTDLEPLWRRGSATITPAPIAGLTHGGGFFCVERLARNYGLACTYKAAPVSSNQSALADAAETMLTEAQWSRGGFKALDEKAHGEEHDRPLAWLLSPLPKT